jgi:hypothetical protein
MKPLKNKNQKRQGISQLAGLLVTVFVIAIFGLAYLNLQNIRDWIVLRSYQPPTAVSDLAQQLSLNAKSRRVFYVNKPAITNSTTFTSACPSGVQEKTIVLGCYHGNQRGIYILDVQDPRLSGVEQVTAGHEFLHAAYDRLSSQDKQKINQLLEDYYKTITDQRIKDTIEAYRQSEPNDVVNEMHSIFGTEIAQLNPELENYYSRYFNNRSAIVAFSDKYQSEFTARKNKIAVADNQLSTMKNQINNLEVQLKQQLAEINSQESQMNNLRSSGSIASYNSMVNPFNNLVYDYNNKINVLQNIINRYNNLVVERNNYVLEESQLIQSLQPNAKKINN